MKEIRCVNGVDVPEVEYARHLGYPPGELPVGRPRETAEHARRWYEEHGCPWSFDFEQGIKGITDAAVLLEDGSEFRSETLAARLSESQCHILYVLALSAGAEVDEEIQRRWTEGRPDDAFALSAYAVAVAEQLALAEGGRLCEQAEASGGALLPRYSPGYDGWTLDDQSVLFALVSKQRDLPLSITDGCQLVPQRSMLTVFGLTPDRRVLPPDLVGCAACSLNPCALRRAPYQEHTMARQKTVRSAEPHWAFPKKALNRWREHHLALNRTETGVEARFFQKGSTCSDGGIPLAYTYTVELDRTEAGYRIREMNCAPTEGDRGHQSMCSYISGPEALEERIRGFKPLKGSLLSEVLYWTPSRNPAGCLCSGANRNHKWLMALQTIHHALSEGPEQRWHNDPPPF